MLKASCGTQKESEDCREKPFNINTVTVAGQVGLL